MAHKIGDRVKEMASSSGTGAFTLIGAVAGFDPFTSILAANGDTTWYCAVNGNEWEIGLGTRTSASVLARPTVPLRSSNTGALVNFSAPPQVFCTVPASQLPTAGAIAPAVSAYASAAQALSVNGWAKVLINTVEFDSTGAFATASNRFQPQVAGYYQITGNWCGTVAATCLSAIYKNGVEFKRGTFIGNTANDAPISALVYLNGTTDYIELFAFSGTAQNTNTGASFTYLQGALVAATGVVGGVASAPPAFSAYRSTNQTGFVSGGGNLAVLFDAEEYDTHGAYDPATGTFTAPVTGIYHIDWGHNVSNMTGGWSSSARLWLNMTSVTNNAVVGGTLVGETSGMLTPQPTSSNQLRSAGSRDVFLVAGDKLNVVSYSWSTTSPITISAGRSITYFNGHLLQQTVLGGAPTGPVFSAVASGAQAFVANAYTKVNCATEEADTDNAYDPALSRFTAPVKGVYEFAAAVNFTSLGYAECSLRKNGTQVRLGSTSNASYNATLGCKIVLNAGDYVEFWAQSSLSQNAVTTNSGTYFGGNLLRAL